MAETLYTQEDLKSEALQHAREGSKKWRGGRVRKLNWAIRIFQSNFAESASLSSPGPTTMESTRAE
jgi:hypothetical protein